jgi:hypothetical protein
LRSLLWQFLSLWSQRGVISLTSSMRQVLSISTTLESCAHCSRYLARLSARNKLTLLEPDSRGRQHSSLIVFSVAVDINSNMGRKNGGDTFCPFKQHSNPMHTAAGIEPDCRLETNSLC